MCYYSNMTTGERLSADPLIQLDPDDRYRGEGTMEYCQCDSLNRACRQSPVCLCLCVKNFVLKIV